LHNVHYEKSELHLAHPSNNEPQDFLIITVWFGTNGGSGTTTGTGFEAAGLKIWVVYACVCIFALFVQLTYYFALLTDTL
jgi:hypothetical protein